MRKDVGRVPDGTGLSQAEPQEGLGPPGFDPSRDVRWHLPTILRWIDENRTATHTPGGTLVGEALRVAAETMESLAYRTSLIGRTTARAERLEWVLEGALATLRLAHDRTLEARDAELFDSLRGTINATCRDIRDALARDSDGSPQGRDREDGLDGEAATARAEGIAQTQPAKSRGEQG